MMMRSGQSGPDKKRRNRFMKNIRKRWIGKVLALSLTVILASGTGLSVFAAEGAQLSTEQLRTEETAGETTDVAGGQNAEAANTEDTENAAEAEAAGETAKDTAEEGTSEEAAADETATEGNAAGEAAAEGKAAEDQVSKTASKKAMKAAIEDKETGDFKVTGDDEDFSFEDGVLTIRGDVKVAMADGKTSTAQRIVIADDSNVTIDGLAVSASDGPAIKVEADAKATLTLKGESTLTGSSGYAAVQVSWASDSSYADLTIKGDGTLNATAGSQAAGIGGSRSDKSVYGNITIESGTINATGSNGAAIGSGATNAGSGKPAANQWGKITINGGTIKAVGNNGQSAGIGGGNHVDSGKIVINGGTITASGYTGIGSGLGGSKHINGDPGPGSVFADIEINGGTITSTGSDTGAGIGGAMYCDAIVVINGGDVTAYGAGRGNTTHGGAGIGGGYQGAADVTINGGTVHAYASDSSAGAGIGSGTAANSSSLHTNDGRTEDSKLAKTTVTITGGEVYAYGGGMGGAGIGSGSGSDKAGVVISGGKVYAEGAKSSESEMKGGAGIGSAYAGADGSEFNENGEWTKKHLVLTDADVTVTGGTVTAIGGWGASGIGSGAENRTARSITVDAEEADVEAYSDGTKFAIDTRTINDGDESFDRIVTGDLMQGTFVFPYTSEDGVEQDTEGLDTIKLVSDSGAGSTELTNMPSGYRSFARTVPTDGLYSVYTDSQQIAEGGGRFFNKCTDDTRTAEDVETGQDIVERNVKYTVSGSDLSDNFYLFPVKTVVVDKEVVADDDTMGKIDTTLYFALWNDVTKDFVKDKNGGIWTESIEVVDGVAQGKAYFAGIDEGTYGIWEIDPDDPNADLIGTKLPGSDTIILKDVTTRHGDTTENDATIDDNVWTDYVTVVNEYEDTTVPIDDPNVPETTPQDPRDPSDPADTNDTTADDPKADAGSSGKARTGDEMDLQAVIMILMAAGCVMGIAGISGRRRRSR